MFTRRAWVQTLGCGVGICNSLIIKLCILFALICVHVYIRAHTHTMSYLLAILVVLIVLVILYKITHKEKYTSSGLWSWQLGGGWR